MVADVYEDVGDLGGIEDRLKLLISSGFLNNKDNLHLA